MLCQVACRVLRSECESVNCEHRTACTQPWIGALHRRDMGATTGLKSYERLLTRSSTLLSTCVYCIYVRAAAARARQGGVELRSRAAWYSVVRTYRLNET